MGPTPALADTIEAALVRAYQNNPQLNAQRASVRSTDENVPQALSGYRPRVALTASAGYQYTDTLHHRGRLRRPTIVTNRNSRRQCAAQRRRYRRRRRCSTASRPPTGPARRRARSPARAKRCACSNRPCCCSAATIYMDYLRDSAIVEVQKSNVRVLEQTLKQTQDRFNVGEVTRTDVAQSEAQLAAGKTQLLTAEANSDHDALELPPHHRQRTGSSRAGLAGRSLSAGNAARRGRSQPDAKIPNVTAAMFGIDVNYLQVKVNEGALLPTVTLQASVQQSYEQTMTIYRSFGASAIAQLSVPIYQGGAEYSLIRQSKETLAQQRLNLEQTRDQTRANMVTAWGQLVAGKAQVASAQSQVTASEIALNGVREEAKAGQRTTLDVLNAQQALVNARVALVTAQHDRVVASYAVLNAVGRLSPQVLKLADHGLRSERALPAGARQLVRRSHARRPLIAAIAASSTGRLRLNACAA